MTDLKAEIDASEVVEDFRSRSAARKRERMRARLLAATTAACGERGPNAVMIEDVLRSADVSRGTFYTHFDSLQQAISELGQTLADEAVRQFNTMYMDVTDPVLRTALGPQLILSRAVIDPNWGRIVAQSEHFSSRSDFVEAIKHNYVQGRKKGVFKSFDIHAAVDLHIGAMVRGAAQLQNRKTGRKAYIRDVATMLLLAAGLPEDQCVAAVRWAEQDLKVRAPLALSWWCNFR